MVKYYFKNLFIGIDQLLNTLFGGWADETLSSRAYRWSLSNFPWPRKIIDTLFFFEKNHCRLAYENERLRSQMPPELRGN